jgi:hypothetical protein
MKEKSNNTLKSDNGISENLSHFEDNYGNKGQQKRVNAAVKRITGCGAPPVGSR